MARRTTDEIAVYGAGALFAAITEAADSARIGVAVTVMEPEVHNVYVNDAACAILGYSPEELLRLPVWTAIAPEDHQRMQARRAQRGADREPMTDEVTVVRKDGVRLPIELTISNVQASGQNMIVSFFRDISDRRSAEEERRQMRDQLVLADRLAAAGRLAAGVAHEINNPLAYVLLNLELLTRELPRLEGPADAAAQCQERLGLIREGVERVAGIVRDLRTFVRGDGEGAPALVELGAVIRFAVRIAAGETRDRARVSCALDELPPIMAPPGRLEQVFLNLIVNAVEAMPSDDPAKNEISIRARAFDDGGKRSVCIEVADNGSGISPEVREHLFDPFYTTKPQGTGLGLWISRNLVTTLRGRIEVDSEPGAGSRFRVILPIDAELIEPG